MRYDATTAHAIEATGLVKRFGNTALLVARILIRGQAASTWAASAAAASMTCSQLSRTMTSFRSPSAAASRSSGPAPGPVARRAMTGSRMPSMSSTAELAGQQLAALVVRRERLCLAAGRIQRTHEKAARAFGQRISGEQQAKLADQAGSLAEGQVGLDPIRQGAGAQLGQLRGHRVRELASGGIGERLAAPGQQRVPQDPRGLAGVAVGQRARHDTPGVQGKQSEQNPQLAAADVDRAARLVPHLKRA